MAREVVFAGDQISKQPQALYEKILKGIADKYDIDIVMSICHARYETMPIEMSFDKLYIFAQLLPKEFEGIKKATVKGYKLNGEDIVFPVKEDENNPSASPCPQGDSLVFTKAPTRAIIISDDNSVPVATILDGALYVLNDFIHSRGKADFEVGSKEFEWILDQAIKAGLIEQIKGGLEEKSKRSLESALRVQFTQRLEKELIQLKAAKDTILQYERGITDATRKAVSTEKIIDAIHKNIDDVVTALDKTWKSVARMGGSKMYSNVSYTKSGIKALTTPVVIKNGSKEYDMGRYEVSLGYDGTCRIIGVDRKIDGRYDHPHITDGQVCWGNFSGQIPKLIGSSEFDVALDMIFTFLCHYDAASPYKTIEHWPIVVKTKEPKQAEAEKVEVTF